MIIPSGPLVAMACIRGEGKISGTVKFYPVNCGTLIAAQISGLPENGFFALHIHEEGCCHGQDFSDTGGHYNPGAQLHPNHAGDLPPLMSCSGNALLAVVTNRFNVWEIIGRSVIIHSEPDDFRNQPAGNAGKRIACGVICRC